MNRIDLQHVKIDKADSCLTYALKRIGKFRIYPFDYRELLESDYFSVADYESQASLSVGDILVWDKEVDTNYFLENEISEQGVIICNPITVAIHYGVYEGAGLVSE